LSLFERSSSFPELPTSPSSWALSVSTFQPLFFSNLSLFLVCAANGFTAPYTALLYGDVLNKVIEAEDPQEIDVGDQIYIFIGLAAGATIIDFCIAYLWQRFATTTVLRMRETMFKNVLEQEVGCFVFDFFPCLICCFSWRFTMKQHQGNLFLSYRIRWEELHHPLG